MRIIFHAPSGVFHKRKIISFVPSGTNFIGAAVPAVSIPTMSLTKRQLKTVLGLNVERYRVTGTTTEISAYSVIENV